MEWGRCSMFMGDYQEKHSKQGYGCYADLSQYPFGKGF